MEHWIIGGILAALLGAAVSWLTYLMSRKTVKAKPEFVSAMSLPRQMVQIGFLVAVYLLSPLTPWNYVELLVGAVVGMTAGMFVFTGKLLKELEVPEPENPEERGDENG